MREEGDSLQTLDSQRLLGVRAHLVVHHPRHRLGDVLGLLEFDHFDRSADEGCQLSFSVHSRWADVEGQAGEFGAPVDVVVADHGQVPLRSRLRELGSPRCISVDLHLVLGWGLLSPRWSWRRRAVLLSVDSPPLRGGESVARGGGEWSVHRRIPRDLVCGPDVCHSAVPGNELGVCCRQQCLVPVPQQLGQHLFPHPLLLGAVPLEDPPVPELIEGGVHHLLHSVVQLPSVASEDHSADSAEVGLPLPFEVEALLGDRHGDLHP